MKRLGFALSLLWFLTLAVPGIARSPDDPSRIVLVDQLGRSFTLAGLRGPKVVIDFISTRCTDACPIANAAFIQLQQRLRAGGSGALLLTVTLDPAYDRPFVMAREAQTLGADPRRWRLASGSLRNVHAIMRAFDVVAIVGRKGIPDVHSTVIYVLGSDGRITKRLLLGTDTVPEVLAALQ